MDITTTLGFKCVQRYKNGNIKTWNGQMHCIKSNDDTIEFMISGRDSEYYAILGSCEYGNYLCLPSIGVGCYIAEFKDKYWNLENLSYYMNYTDAVTIVSGIYHIEKIWGKS